MRRVVFVLVAVVALAGVVAYMAPASGQADQEAAPIFGLKIPPGYRDWRLISVAHEEFWATTSRSSPPAKGSCRSRTARSLPGSPGVTTRWRKAKKPLAVANLSWPGHPRTEFSLWSRTRENTPRPTAGGSLNSTTVNPPTRRCTTPAFPATRSSKLATLSSTVMHLDAESHGMPPAYDHWRESMAKVTYDKQLTALVMIDPYNDFISEGGKIWDRLKRVAEANNCVPHCCRSSMPRVRRGFASSTRCIIDTVPATTRFGSTLRPFRRQRGRERASNTAPGVGRSGGWSPIQ
jgi:hypothetical protein